MQRLSMRPKIGVAQRQSVGQSLVMTPQLTQSIKLLVMSNVEVDAFVREQALSNPLIEIERKPRPTPPRNGPTRTGPLLTGPLRTSHGQPAGEDVWDRTAAHVTLADHLKMQIGCAGADPVVTAAARYLADSLEPDGRLVALQDHRDRLAIGRAQFAAAIALLRSCEPAGVGALNLAQCLALQLAAKDRLDPAMRAIVANLPLVEAEDRAALRAISGLDEEDLADALTELAALDPRPGLAFERGAAAVTPPDLLMTPLGTGGWRIELNGETLPRVLRDRDYYADTLARTKDDADRAYLTQAWEDASWLVRSLDSRARTVVKVAKAIVAAQDAYFVDGVRALVPLSLQTIADRIGMHESSVSRVTTSKTIETPQGLVPLKFFFSSSLRSVDGATTHSAPAVQDRIRALVADERETVLSDDAIVRALGKQGVDIARRTVAKYRDLMGIPSSVERRRAAARSAASRVAAGDAV